MTMFDRMRTSLFPPKAEAAREPRVAMRVQQDLSDRVPEVDERTSAAALEILENTSWQRVHDRLRAEALATIANSQPGDIATREDAYRKLRVLDEIKGSIQSAADDMKIHRRKHSEPLTE